MAATDAAQGKPAATQGTVLADRVDSVMGTAGIETAMWCHQRTDAQAVKLDAGNK